MKTVRCMVEMCVLMMCVCHIQFTFGSIRLRDHHMFGNLFILNFVQCVT
jgi:hypothetical protein